VIFVTVGTQEFPFDRLLSGLDGIDEELVVQGGPSSVRPEGATWFDYLSYPEVRALARRSRVVVCHAGVGSVMTAVAEGKRPVVVPRLKRYRETVDDHQLPFARRLAEAGLVTLVEDPALLREALAETPAAPASLGRGGGLAADLRGYLEDLASYSR
jgi:UDP-N-acetylglucosamine transferase subunit ALG13